jgi:hypothetical protein
MPGTYRDMKLPDLVRKYTLQLTDDDITCNFGSIEPSLWLVETLARAKEVGYTNEKARSERVISPILIEARKYFEKNLILYTGELLDVNREEGLTGECDFIFSWGGSKEILFPPICLVTEAKKEDFTAGKAQCTAQLIGAQQFNQAAKTATISLWGCVTNAVEWIFIRLTAQNLVMDANIYTLDSLPKILGILHSILAQSKPII